MNSKTCLLVSDDPDDHQMFSEAITELSPHAILIVVLSSSHAKLLLETKSNIAEFIFVDVSMSELDVTTFSHHYTDHSTRLIPTVFYGDEEDEFNIPAAIKTFPFFSKDFTYKELKNFLKKILGL